MKPVNRSSRHRRPYAAACILAVVWSALALAEGVRAEPGPPFAIESVRAHFYYQGSGTFSDADLFDPSLVLRNTIIGEGGDAKGPSSITLVLVKLSGSFLAGTKGAIEVDAHAKGRKYPRQSIPLRALFSETGTVTAPFLIHDTPCSPLTLEIRLVGVPGRAASVEKTIPFQCGE
jgi:hypothetical protein